MALRAEIPSALGSIIACNTMGTIIDKFGQRKAVLFALAICVTTQVLLIVYNERNKFDWMSLAISFFCGMHEGALQTFSSAMLGNEFEDKITSVATRLIV